jgi:hypothetical protein
MTELIKARCGQGWLILTEESIIVQRPGISHSIARASFTGLDMKVTMWAGPWSAYTLIFHGAGVERLKASIVKAKDAKAIKALLTGR